MFERLRHNLLSLQQVSSMWHRKPDLLLFRSIAGTGGLLSKHALGILWKNLWLCKYFYLLNGIFSLYTCLWHTQYAISLLLSLSNTFYKNSPLTEPSIIRTIFLVPWKFELWRAYCIPLMLWSVYPKALKGLKTFQQECLLTLVMTMGQQAWIVAWLQNNLKRRKCTIHLIKSVRWIRWETFQTLIQNFYSFIKTPGALRSCRLIQKILKC